MNTWSEKRGKLNLGGVTSKEDLIARPWDHYPNDSYPIYRRIPRWSNASSKALRPLQEDGLRRARSDQKEEKVLSNSSLIASLPFSWRKRVPVPPKWEWVMMGASPIFRWRQFV